MIRNQFRFQSGIALLALILNSASAAFAGELGGISAEVFQRLQDLENSVRELRGINAKQSDELSQLRSRVERPKGEEARIAQTPGLGKPVVTQEEQKFTRLIHETIPWTKGMDFKGDLRLRYEGFSHTSDFPGDQNRFRYRLRYGFEKRFSDDWRIGVQLMSSNNTDPTSGNQTLTGDFTFKPINISRAYAVWTPPSVLGKFGPLTRFEVGGGKFENPYNKTSSVMIWDRDVEPEGLYEKLAWQVRPNLELFTNLGQFILQETNAAGSKDAELYAYQGGFNLSNLMIPWPGMSQPAPASLLSAVAFYDYGDYSQTSNFTVSGTSLARGNTNVDADATRLDARDFNVVDLYTELNLVEAWGGKPLSLFFDVAKNVDTHANSIKGFDNKLAWGLGATYGKAKNKGDWEASYGYYYIPPDAVVGAFNESDFGNGHADNYGSIVKLSYALSNYMWLNGAAYFVTPVTAGSASRDDNVARFQADLTWKF